MKTNKHEGVTVSGNSITLNSILKLTDGYQVEFSNDDSIGQVLRINTIYKVYKYV